MQVDDTTDVQRQKQSEDEADKRWSPPFRDEPKKPLPKEKRKPTDGRQQVSSTFVAPWMGEQGVMHESKEKQHEAQDEECACLMFGRNVQFATGDRRIATGDLNPPDEPNEPTDEGR